MIYLIPTAVVVTWLFVILAAAVLGAHIQLREEAEKYEKLERAAKTAYREQNRSKFALDQMFSELKRLQRDGLGSFDKILAGLPREGARHHDLHRAVEFHDMNWAVGLMDAGAAAKDMTLTHLDFRREVVCVPRSPQYEYLAWSRNGWTLVPSEALRYGF